ncbi:MAG: IgGFc-binding protein, partial [Myxococcota bacterium]|nr:IgGFc-binding protein [Myxococcota bacterium]
MQLPVPSPRLDLLVTAFTALLLAVGGCASSEGSTGGDAGPGEDNDTFGTGVPDVADQEMLCTPGERRCDVSSIQICNLGGDGWIEEEGCADDKICFSGLCMDCFPGVSGCDGVVQRRCSEEGEWYNEQDCQAGGMDCLLGACVSPCFEDYKSNTYSGCDYWAIDLDNVADAQDGPFALLVANLADIETDIVVTRRESDAVTTATAYSVTVQPGALEVIPLPQRHLGSAGIGWNAWRVETNSPVVAYQFNPLSNVDVFSNDATLLLPVHTYGKHYIAVTQPQLLGVGAGGQGLAPYRGTVSVVTTSSDTTVTLTPTVKTLAGPDFPAMVAGETYTFNLHPYQVLNIKSDEVDGDLTGTEIFANKPIGVFAGHESALSSTACCTDHLEQQLYAVNQWGRRYVAAKSMPRDAEPDYWRVVASEDQTTVTFTPIIAAPVTLQKGEFYELSTTMDFVVDADRPVLVTQLLASSGEVVQPPAGTPCETAADCHPGYSCDILD